MTTSTVDVFVSQFERRVLIAVLRAHPEWTLEQLMRHRGEYQAALRDLTIDELQNLPLGFVADRADGPPIQIERLERAKRTTNPVKFDAIVLEVLGEAPWPVRAGYMRARVGGPRWKLQNSLGRLVSAGRVSRSGLTSDTIYSVLDP